MKKLLNVASLCALLLISSLSLLPPPAHANHLPPADPGASQATKNLLNYLAHLPDQSNHRLLTGQWCCWHGMNASALTVRDQITALSGNPPAVWGYPPFSANTPREFNLTSEVIQNTITWWNAGGLVQIHGLFRNPFTQQTWGSTSLGGGTFSHAYTAGNPVYDRLRADLSEFADALQLLENAGVVVIMDLYNEANVCFFWFGACSSGGTDAEFKLLWQYTANYFTVTRGLHNILFAVGSWHAPFSLARYPSSASWDIAGIDLYRFTTLYGNAKHSAYDTLVGTGKPVALVEFPLSRYGVGTATSYAGVNQSSPIDAVSIGTGEGTTLSTSITTVADHALISDCALGGEPLTIGAGQTSRANRIVGVATGSSDGAAVSTVNEKTPVGSETMDWTQLTKDWAISAISLKPVVP